MPTFTWIVPAPPSPTPSEPASVAADQPAEVLFGNLDQELDPVTSDYVDTGRRRMVRDGELTDGRRDVARFVTTCGPPIRTLARAFPRCRGGEPVTPEMVIDDTRRAMQVLVGDGLISDLSVQVGSFDEETGALSKSRSTTRTSLPATSSSSSTPPSNLCPIASQR
jgi:hypothetical protein